MLLNAEPHFAPAIELGLHALVFVKGAFVRATESRQVAQNKLRGRRAERKLVVVPAPEQGEAQPLY